MMNEKRIEEIVRMLDNKFEKGVGHVNLDVADINGEKIDDTKKDTGNSCKQSACEIPTFHDDEI